MKKDYLIKPGTKLILSKTNTSDTGGLSLKKEAVSRLKENINTMFGLQAKLYAQDKYAMLIIFQAMDAAGKDGTIKHVMSGLNPQGTQVFSFKQPSKTELDHGYLWRINKSLPEKGRIGIFNRSHYEDVLVVRVHNLINEQKIPTQFKTKDIWKQRYRQINDFEKYLYENGIVVLKFYLQISKDEQKKRFLKRIDDPSKNWKFSQADIDERAHWEEYQKAYQEAISATSKKTAPWFVIPADKKWFARLAVSEIIVEYMKDLKPEFPSLSKEQIGKLKSIRAKLVKD
jgi:PPK2 family polyphosphate:nucleotide phosphotransferase